MKRVSIIVTHLLGSGHLSRALTLDAEIRAERRDIEELTARVAKLTRREREVCALVVSGRLNKQIAAALGTSEKTIKVHRARVMAKMHAGSLADLVRMMEHLERARASGGVGGAAPPTPVMNVAGGDLERASL